MKRDRFCMFFRVYYIVVRLGFIVLGYRLRTGWTVLVKMSRRAYQYAPQCIPLFFRIIDEYLGNLC